MKAHVGERSLALYAWADLPEKERGAVEEHLAVCEICRELLAEFHLVRNVLGISARDPDPADLVEVRGRVLGEVRSAPVQERSRRWWFAGAAVSLASMILAIFIAGEGRRITTNEPRAAAIQAKLDEPPRTAPKPVTEVLNRPKLLTRRTQHRHPDRGIRSITLVSQAEHAPILKMATFDPDVVILWESTGRIQHE